MRIEYYHSGKVVIASGSHNLSSDSPLMKQIAKVLQFTGQNVQPAGQTMCGSFIDLNHPIDSSLSFEGTLPSSFNQEDLVIPSPEKEDDIEIVYPQEDKVERLPANLL